MKKLILLSIFLAPLVSAQFMTLNLECANSLCIPNRVTAYNLTLTNMGEETMKILGFKVISATDETLIFQFFNDKPTEIIPPLSHTFSIRKKFPFPNEDDKTILNICLILEPQQDSWGKAGKSIENCYKDRNFTFISTQCMNNFDCEQDHLCNATLCVPLQCDYCQYPDQYACKDYDCCQNSECTQTEFCKDNLCKALECSTEEYIINHSCSTACSQNESFTDYTCTPLDCGDDEIIQNHTCLKFTCKNYEYAFNHSCDLLNCSDIFYPDNHTCLPLKCKDTEFIFNHTCEKLKCNILQKPQENECRVNSFIVLQIFALFMIYYLVSLIRKKREYLLKKQYVHKFFKILGSRKRENINTTKSSTKK